MYPRDVCVCAVWLFIHAMWSKADKPYALYVRGIRGVASIPEPDTSRLTALRQPLTACPLRTIEGDRTRKELLVNKVPLKQTAFPVAISMPDRQPFVGRSVINTHPSSRFLKSKESPPKVLKLKTSFESTNQTINTFSNKASTVSGAQMPESLLRVLPPCSSPRSVRSSQKTLKRSERHPTATRSEHIRYAFDQSNWMSQLCKFIVHFVVERVRSYYSTEE